MPVVQPEKIKNNPDLRARLEAIQPDAIIVVAYGRIIPDWMLNLPRLGQHQFACVAAAQIPRRRSHPVGGGQRGDRHRRHHHAHRSGARHRRHAAAAIPADRTGSDSRAVFSPAGGERSRADARNSARGWKRARSSPFRRTMPERRWPRFCSAKMPWSISPGLPREIYNRWRGFQPWPGAYTFFRGKKLTLHRLLPAGSTAAPSRGDDGGGQTASSWPPVPPPGWNCWKCRWKGRSDCRWPTFCAAPLPIRMRGWARSLAGRISPARKTAFDLLLELRRKPDLHSDRTAPLQTSGSALGPGQESRHHPGDGRPALATGPAAANPRSAHQKQESPSRSGANRAGAGSSAASGARSHTGPCRNLRKRGARPAVGQ